MRFRFGFIGLVLSLGLAGCAGNTPQESRYQMAKDAAPIADIDVAKIPDALPVVEPVSRQGNKSPYTVLGKTYQVLPSSSGYESIGTASWYGAKFHGHLTSNGETYNMFAMTAAHKSLPLPTYLRVTNLMNNKSVIVRVNDRGPFHDDRLIDLSYAAAVKLGFHNSGTAPVKLEAIDPVEWQLAQKQPAGRLPGSIFLQIGAFSSLESAQRLKSQLDGVTSEPVIIASDTTQTPQLHRVRIGPVESINKAESLRAQINEKGFGLSLIVSEPNS